MANAIDKHHFRLLKEIDELSATYGFAYVLANHSTWDAVKFQRYHGDIYETTVMMRAEDLKKLKMVLPSDRDVVDYDLHGCNAKYVDTMSVLLDYRNDMLAKHPMVGVDIVIAERSGVEGEYVAGRPDGGSFRFPDTIFDNVSRGCIEDAEFNLPADVDDYLTRLVDDDWRNKTWPYKLFKKTVYVTHVEDMDPKVFLKQPVVRKLYSNKTRAFMAGYWLWLDTTYRPAKKELDKYRNYLQRTEDRFNLWEKYYPQKQKILDMANDSAKHDELREILRDLLDKIWHYERVRVPLSIDEDLLQVCIPFLIEEHGEKKTQIAIDRIPQEFREKSVADVLREAGVDHPLLRSDCD